MPNPKQYYFDEFKEVVASGDGSTVGFKENLDFRFSQPGTVKLDFTFGGEVVRYIDDLQGAFKPKFSIGQIDAMSPAVAREDVFPPALVQVFGHEASEQNARVGTGFQLVTGSWISGVELYITEVGGAHAFDVGIESVAAALNSLPTGVLVDPRAILSVPSGLTQGLPGWKRFNFDRSFFLPSGFYALVVQQPSHVDFWRDPGLGNYAKFGARGAGGTFWGLEQPGDPFIPTALWEVTTEQMYFRIYDSPIDGLDEALLNYATGKLVMDFFVAPDAATDLLASYTRYSDHVQKAFESWFPEEVYSHEWALRVINALGEECQEIFNEITDFPLLRSPTRVPTAYLSNLELQLGLEARPDLDEDSRRRRLLTITDFVQIKGTFPSFDYWFFYAGLRFEVDLLYSEDYTTFITSFPGIPETFFLTPHFDVVVDFSEATGVLLDFSEIEAEIIKIKPAETVIERFGIKFVLDDIYFDDQPAVGEDCVFEITEYTEEPYPYSPVTWLIGDSWNPQVGGNGLNGQPLVVGDQDDTLELDVNGPNPVPFLTVTGKAGNNFQIGTPALSFQAAAQKFLLSALTGRLWDVKLELFKGPAAATLFDIRIETVTVQAGIGGVPTGVLADPAAIITGLSSAALPAAAGTLTTFGFPVPFTLATGFYYAIVVQYQGGAGPPVNDYIEWVGGGPAAPGGSRYTTNSGWGTTWIEQVADAYNHEAYDEVTELAFTFE